jgi:hypothetical protein
MIPSARTRLFAAIVSSALLAAPALAQSIEKIEGATADEVMTHAKSQAAAEHKRILLTFGASWCGNCRLFDRFLADPAMAAILSRQFVYADLNTGDREGDARHPNLPGGQTLQAEVGGAKAGYPYIVMLDATGKPLANSISPQGNIGYPDAPSEIDWFMTMLAKAAPSLSQQDAASVHAWLKAHSTTH